MVKIALFDIDGVLNNVEKFSLRYEKEYGVSVDLLLPFFKNEFQDCLVGKLDLKEQLEKVKGIWKFNGSTEELLKFWFEGEINVNKEVLRIIETVKNARYPVIAVTNQEKYRTNYLKKKLDLDKLFYKTYSSAQIGVKKPEKGFYEYIKNDMKIDYNEFAYWDDDEDNVVESAKLGISSYRYLGINDFREQVMREFKIKL